MKAAAHHAFQSSLTTHPRPIAASACAFLAYAIARAINDGAPAGARAFLDQVVADYLGLLDDRVGGGDEPIRALLESAQPDHSLERCWNWKAPSLDIEGTLARRGSVYNGYQVRSDYFGAYCMDGLAVALHAVYQTTSFDDALVRCVNFLGDADSTGAVAGQLAGAIYGYRAIHSGLIEQLRRWDDGEVALRAVLLYELGARAARPPSATDSEAGSAR